MKKASITTPCDNCGKWEEVDKVVYDTVAKKSLCAGCGAVRHDPMQLFKRRPRKLPQRCK